MKLQLAVTTALAAQLFVAAPLFAKGEPSNPDAVSASPLTVEDCSARLSAHPQLARHKIRSIEGFEVDGAMLNIALVDTGRKSVCALMTAPEHRALSAAEYADLKQLSALAGSDERMPNLTAGDATEKSMSNAAVGLVYPGYCGASNAPIASAFFLAQRLALSSGITLPPSVTDKLCVLSNGKYYDVHATRRSGSADSEMVALSLMQPAPSSTGFTVYPLTMSSGNLSARGAFSAVSMGTQTGPVHTVHDPLPSSAGFATFITGRSFHSSPTPLPAPLLPGSSFWVNAAPATPIGVHARTTVSTSPATYPQTGYVDEQYTVLRRFGSADTSLLTNWANTAAAPTMQQVTITSPANDQLVNSLNPVSVNVTSSSQYALTLDGVAVSNPMTVSDGWHTLVAYNPSMPKYRHTIRFQAQKLFAAPDAFEVDDTREQYKPLFEGQPQQHNFHKTGDKDWAAFAVGENQRSTVTLAGGLANWATLKLYRQLNYPYGAIELLGSDGGKTQLIMSSDSGSSGTTAYYVEASSTMQGQGSNYVLAVTTAPMPDAYEIDDTREQFQALYEGQPQTHTFHTVNDDDWTGFAVGPGVTSRVALGGAVAAHAAIELYRHVNWPNGEIVLVASNAAIGGEVSVEHTAPTNEDLGVYYVRTRPFNEDPNAAKFGYTLSVTTY